MNAAPDPDPNLASLLDRGLKGLPLLTAPRTLAPNVLALLETRLAGHWWLRAWWQWPVAARGAFLFLTLALIAFASTGSWFVSDGLNQGARLLSDRFATLAELGQRFAPLTETGLSLAERFGASLLFYGAIVALFAYVACLCAGTALVRIVWNRH
jgi:hypothetical protein